MRGHRSNDYGMSAPDPPEPLHVVSCDASCADFAQELVEDALGWLNGYYAGECLRLNTCIGLRLDLHGQPIGIALVYRVDAYVKLCVVYYIVVREEYRGRGYGSVLLESAEEVCSSIGNVDLYLATTSAWNIASQRLFESHCYTCIDYDILYERLGWEKTSIIIKATCSYEDDIVCMKPVGDNLWSLLTRLRDTKKLNRLWKRICLEPWFRLRS